MVNYRLKNNIFYFKTNYGFIGGFGSSLSPLSINPGVVDPIPFAVVSFSNALSSVEQDAAEMLIRAIRPSVRIDFFMIVDFY